jgi:glutamyl-tRNA reductase
VKILLLGMNHRSAPLEVREHYAHPDPGPALQKLVSRQEIDEAVLVSTCNRVDLVVTTRQPEAARHCLLSFFHRELAQGEHPAGDRRLDDYVYEYRDREAARHVFRVASSIDSMVVGEPQILGEMKVSYRAAVELQTCGPVLSRLFQRAFATAKRVRNETRIAQRPVSVARVAVDLARQIFEDFSDKAALMVGAGEMIEMALTALQREGLREVRVANRTHSRAEGLALRYEASAHELGELDELLAHSDMVLSCIGGDGPLLTHERVRAALKARRRRPIFFIDIGVPRNVEARVNELDAAFVYDIDDLQEVAANNAEQRQQESSRGELIVAEEQQRFDGWMAALHAVPTIRHLRSRAEAVREAELRRNLHRLGLDAGQRESVEALTRAIVNKILHAPLSNLRAETDREESLAMLEAARSLFSLDDPGAPGAHADEELRDELLRQRMAAAGVSDPEAFGAGEDALSGEATGFDRGDASNSAYGEDTEEEP